LLEACEARLSDPTIYLTVRASNTPAISLYEQAGYRRLRTRPSYYPDGEDGIEMRKERPLHP
jgi:ribosomal-protein-alanine N-acetyltransferase